jgi:uncharacterized protein
MIASAARRRRRWWTASALGLLTAIVVAALAFWQRERIPMHWQVPLRAWLAGISVDHGVRMRMADGVQLAASVYYPRGDRKNLATVLVRLPYNRLRDGEALGAALLFARNGYAVVLQDVRGKHGSQGEFAAWRGATADGAATLEWITAQPWSSGKVGTFGCSALGELQYVLARANHPAHAAMIALAAGGAAGSVQGRHEYFGLFEGGVFQLATGFGWLLHHGAKDPRTPRPQGVDVAAALRGLPVSGLVARYQPAANAYADYLRMPLGDAAWASYDFVSDADRWSIPTLDINTWGDQTLAATFALAEHARTHAPAGRLARHHVIIAPGNHCEHAEAAASGRFGELQVRNAAQPYAQWYLQWFDHWLRGQPDALADAPAYRYFVLGENRWLSAQTWPPAGTQTQRWYLSSGRGANSRDGDGLLAPSAPAGAAKADTYDYDPADPTPSRGGPVCCTGNPADRFGPADQADVEARRDVLVYTSAPLAEPLRIVGPLRARLSISSSAPDTDFIARLVHVRPDGHATSIQEGALRARYRDGITRPAPMTAGQTYSISVDMRSIAYLVPQGHRLRLDVASSAFPRLERNLNTGERNAEQTQAVVARNRVFHGSAAQSYVELPVLTAPAR